MCAECFQEQDNERVDTSFTNGSKTIIETPPQRRARVPKPKRENVLKLSEIGARSKIWMFSPEEDKYTKLESNDKTSANGKGSKETPIFIFRPEELPTLC